MIDKNKGASPIEMANDLTPWWMWHIQEFDDLEVHTCKLDGKTSQGKVIKSEGSYFWTVCGHYKPKGKKVGVEAFGDFETEDAALKFYDKLIAAYPHLGGDSKKLPQKRLRREPAP